MKTRSIKKEDMQNGTYPRQWWLVDGEGMTLGRLATQVAGVLRGKHKPIYTPHVDTGDFVVIVNAEKINLSGNKMKDKIYYHHTGYPGGLKQARAEEILNKKPTDLIYKAVKGMMPKNALNRTSLRKLKIYAGPEHPHEAQKPQPLPLKG